MIFFSFVAFVSLAFLRDTSKCVCPCLDSAGPHLLLAAAVVLSARFGLERRPYDIVATSHDAGIIEAIPDTVSIDALKKVCSARRLFRSIVCTLLASGSAYLVSSRHG